MPSPNEPDFSNDVCSFRFPSDHEVDKQRIEFNKKLSKLRDQPIDRIQDDVREYETLFYGIFHHLTRISFEYKKLSDAIMREAKDFRKLPPDVLQAFLNTVHCSIAQKQKPKQSSESENEEAFEILPATFNELDSEIDFQAMNNRINEYREGFRQKEHQKEEKDKAEVEAMRRQRQLKDKENGILLNECRTNAGREKVKNILEKSPTVLFVLSSEAEKNITIIQILTGKHISFKIECVDGDAEVRLALKELSGIEKFPQLFVNGEHRNIEEFTNEVKRAIKS